MCNSYLVDLGEHGLELVDVHKVLAHLGGQHQVDDGLPHGLERVPVQVLEDVDAVVGHGELEAERGVVVLQHGDVVVQVRQLGVGVAEEGAVAAGVVQVVDGRRDQAGGLVQLVAVLLHLGI